MDELNDLNQLGHRSDGPAVSGSSATFQALKRVFQRGEERQRSAARMLLIRSGVWMPVDVYRHWPVLLPWVIRRNRLANHEKGRASVTTGLRLEDNAPVGKLKTNLPVNWGGRLAGTFQAKPLKRGATEWMQSHCWSGLADHPERSTSTHPLTNTFVPNLVWLPHAIGRLTDDESLIFKDELRAIAWARYRPVRVAPALADIADEAWDLLGAPRNQAVASEELDLVNEFRVTAKFYQHRLKHLLQVWEAVNAVLDGDQLEGSGLTPKTYRESMPSIPRTAQLALRHHLAPFTHAARQFEMPASAVKTQPQAHATHAQLPPAHAPQPPARYAVTTPAGTFVHLPRNRAALRIVRSAMEAGVDPGAIKQLLLGKLRTVPEELDGDNLWKRMQASGISGPKRNWFVDEPIHIDQTSWVVNANGWTQAFAEAKLPQLCAMTGGAVSFALEPPIRPPAP